MSPENWETVARQTDALPAGWRRHGARSHLDLVARAVGEPRGRWLKTDLYEELDPDRALVPRLTGDWFGIDVAHAATVAHRGRAAQADVRFLPFSDGTFDGVLSTSTLDHFDSTDQIAVALAELRRVTRPGGRLLLTLDNPANPLIRLRNALPASIRSRTGLAPFHVGPTLSARAARTYVEEAGFTVVATEHLLHAPHVVGTRLARFESWERRVLPAVDRLGRTRFASISGHYVAVVAEARR